MNRRVVAKLPARHRKPWSTDRRALILLTLTALLCVVALDFLGSRLGRAVYLFRAPSTRAAAPEPVAAGIVPERPEAEKPLPDAAAVKPVSREAAPSKPIADKHVPESAAPERTAAPKTGPDRAEPRMRGRVALVIDDMGNSLEALDALVALRRPLTVSVLPFSPHAAETARRARANGFDVLLHLPLESLNGTDGSPYTEGLIRASMSDAEIRASLADQLDRVPFIAGVNNHMGSLVTADARLMRIILEPLRERGLFFVDSRTIGRSVAYQEARRLGLRAAARDVFLDDMADVKSVRERIRELVALARRTGAAVGIGHPYAETLQALREEFEDLEDRGVEAVAVSLIVR